MVWPPRLSSGGAVDTCDIIITYPMKLDLDNVWLALASPHRRTILDRLREEPRRTGDITRSLPELSRFAVMQHLGVLEESGLVLFRKEGRQRFNYLNAIPLQEIYDRWVNSLASGAAETTLHFKRYAENKTMSDFRQVQIEHEVRIKASPEACFNALTRHYNDWFPHRYKPDSEVYLDAEVGGTSGERFSAGGGAIHASVVFSDAPNKLILSGPGAMLDGCSVYAVHTFVADGDSTVYKRRMDLWGVVSPEMEQGMRQGSQFLIEKCMVEFIEKGIKYSAEVRA